MAGGTRLFLSLPSYLIIAVAAVLSLLSFRAPKTVPRIACLGTTIVMSAYVIGRSLYSPIHYLALEDFFMVLACLSVYLLTSFYITSTRDRLCFVVLLFAIAIAHIVVGAIQFTQLNGYMPFGFLRGDNLPHASGMFVSANHYAGYLEPITVLALSMTVWSRWPLWAKILTGYMAGFCLFGMAISGNRGGYYSVIAALIVFVVASIYTVRVVNPRKLILVWILLTMGVVVVIAVTAALMLHSNYLTVRMHKMVGNDVRIYNWMAALDQFRLSPIIGTGSGTHLIYARLFRRPPLQADPVHAHCDYLELLSEYGIIGACVVTAFLFIHVRAGLRGYSFLLRKRLLASFQPRSNTFAFHLGVICSLAALAVHSVVDFNMHAPADALLYAFFFGTLANPGFEEKSTAATNMAPWFRFILPVIGIWLLITATPLAPAEYCAETSRVALRNRDFLRSLDYAHKALGEVPLEPEGVDKFIKVFGGNPNNPNCYLYLGEANRGVANGLPNHRLREQFLQRAVEAFRKGLAIFPQDERMLIRLGQALDGLQLYDEAELAFQEAIQVDPNLGIIYGYYGTHLQAMGMKAEAAENYKKGKQLANESIEDLGRKELGM